ncbi:MAG TPA: hypothetical protein VFK14_10530 [Solirubrobacterales bacterium]|nr:hypothetical protein [Solirubrobacterales bacterium]
MGDGRSFAAAVAGSTWVVVVLCAFGAALTWAFVRDPNGPVAEPPVGELHHHMHHRRFHL